MKYNPYPYQPMMRNFYEGAQHVNSVASFNRWLQNSFPAVHQKIAERKPELLDSQRVVESGKISPMTGSLRAGKSGSALYGLGQASIYEYDLTVGESGGEPVSIVSQWGKDILDFGKGLLAAKQQQDLIKLNIARAEQGLAPVEASAIAPQVNVGMSPQVQTMAMLAIGGLVVVGLLSVARRR